MRFLVTILFALVLTTAGASASDVPPTSRITLDTPARSQLIGYTGEALTFSSSTSSANCGTITLREWRVNGGSWVSGTDFTYTVNLASGVYEDTYTLELKTTNSCNLYHTVSETITIRRDQRVYFAKDHLGSVRATVSEAGDVISYSDYYPFGLVMPGRSSNSANPNDNYKFIGEELDDEAGLTLMNLNARMYDPVTGRFNQIDPLFDHPAQIGLSPYNYSWNNPVNLSDPSGECPLCVAGAIWVGVEIGLAIYDIYDVVTTLSDGNASNKQKFFSVASATAGFFLPGGGYSGIDDAVRGGAKLLDSGRLVEATLSYSDEVSDLVQTTGKLGDEAKELITITKSGNFADAGTVTNSLIGDLGDDAIEHIGRNGPFKGKISGQKSADGKRGFRIDYDPDKGAHINWWNGNQKGAIPFDGGLDQARRIVDNVIGN